jgi:serine protease Do
VRLAPGYSGGILADAEGRVIGINTMIFHGLGLAIPSNEVRDFVSGVADTVRLGVEMIPVREGLMVVGTERGSLAERSGVRIGDLLRVTPEKLRQLLSDVKVKGSADIPILRGGQMKTLRVHTVEAGARAA